MGARARAILEQFWMEDDRAKPVEVIELEGWIDVLEPFTPEEVRRAYAAYQVGGPRTATGRLYKPDPGALALIVLALREGVDASDPVALCRKAWGRRSLDDDVARWGAEAEHLARLDREEEERAAEARFWAGERQRRRAEGRPSPADEFLASLKVPR